jgi:flavodoxin I
MAKKLVVYDSVFGNTEKIAEAIGEALGDALVINVSKVTKEDLENMNILLVGSPTRAFRPTPATMTFIKGLEPNALFGVKAAAFDTRIPFDQAESGFLKFLIKLFGYAETKIAKALTKAGGELALPSEGFGVSGTEGPLVDGELERAQDWARGVLYR